AEYKSGEYMKLVRNEYYVGEPAKVENFVLQFIPNDDTAKAALLKGDVHIWIGLASLMEGLEEMNTVPYSEGRVAYTRINRVSPNLQDKDVRKAIFYAIDRNDILTAAYSSLDYATPSVSFLPKTNGYYTEDLEQYNRDVEKAKSLLEGKTVPTLKICYIADDSAQTAMATVMQAQLAEVGITLELCGVDQAAYMAAAYDCENADYDLYLGGYIMTIDPAGYDGMFATGNMINYASAEIDALFEAGKATTDPDERKAIYTELQQKVADEALFYPMGTNLRLLVVNPKLKGLDEAALVSIVTFEDIGRLHF
ncbi:MAG: ABC transporter substrate-binding protein, partial [Oscillospiraceae bacterium]|nr:ABC transporter substrate-binding protein [Oscillospiraceae bacterium]